MSWDSDISKLKVQIEYWYQLLSTIHSTHLDNLDDYQPEGANVSYNFSGFVDLASSHRSDLDSLFTSNEDFTFWLSNIAIDSINPGDDALIEELKKFMMKGVSISGTVTFTNGSVDVTGSGTSFSSDLAVGDWIYAEIDGYFYREKIESITNDSALKLSNPYRGTTSSGQTLIRIQTIKTNGVTVDFPSYGSSLTGDKFIVFTHPYDQFDFLFETPKRTQTWTFECVYDLHDDASLDYSGEFLAKSGEGVEHDYIDETGAKEHYNGILAINSQNTPTGNLISSNASFQGSFNTTSGFASWAKASGDDWNNCSRDTDNYVHYTAGTRTKISPNGTGSSCKWSTDFTLSYYALNSLDFDPHTLYEAIYFYRYEDTVAGDASSADGQMVLTVGTMYAYGPTDGIKKSTQAYTSAASPSISLSSDKMYVTGTGTSFTTEYARGSLFWVESDGRSYAVEIKDVVDNTHLYLKKAYTGTGTDYPAGDNTLSGTIAITNGSTAVTGNGTHFLSEIAIGDLIWNADDDTISDAGVVASIESDTALTLSAAYGGTTRDPAEYNIKCTGWHWLEVADYPEYFWQDNLSFDIQRQNSTSGSVYVDEVIFAPSEFYPEIGEWITILSRTVNIAKGDSFTIDVTNTNSAKIQRMLALDWRHSLPHYTTPVISDP